MVPTSANYKSIINSNGRDFHAKAHVAFADGTAIDLDDRNIMASSGIAIEDAVSDSNKFEVGSAIVNETTLKLNNYEGIFNNYSFKGAVITPFVGLTTAVSWKDGKIIEWIPKGIFNVLKSPAIGSEINIIADDNMSKLDVAYSKSTLKYPATLGQIAADVCSTCGVVLATTTFSNSTFSVASRPTETSITCREILSYVAQLAGCFARCNKDGAIEIRWYEENGKLYDVGIDAFSYNVADSDTTITGVEIDAVSDANSDKNTAYSTGKSGFTIHITDNPLAQGSGLQNVVNTLGTKFIGFSFRSYTVSSPANPAIEAGDIVNMTDKSGVVHKTFVSRLSYEIDENEEYNADAETADENQSQRFSAAQKAQESADNAQQTADDAKQEVELANVKIGDLTVRITATEDGLESKVSKNDLGTDIQQHASDVVFAFNNVNGTTQSLKFTGDGFDFYSGEVLVCHIGVAYDSEAGGYEACIQPKGGGLGTYFTNKGGYSMICMGAIKGASIAADGLISTDGYISASGYKVSSGESGKTEMLPLMFADGKSHNVRCVNGLLIDHD